MLRQQGAVELSAGGQARPDNVSNWLASLAALIPTPDRYARYTTSWDTALSFLKITDSTLQTLVDKGLRHRDVDNGRFFDDNDVWTLGFYSRTNRSTPELASKSVIRFVRGTPEEWIRPMSWRVRTFAACPDRDACDGTWAHAPLRLDEWDGRLVEATIGPGAGRPAPGGQVGGRPAVVVLDCLAESRGRRLEIRSREARDIFRETLDELRTGKIRFQALPAALHADPDVARHHGTANCMSTATHLARTLVAAGLTARSRNGYLAGVGAMPHGWAEVREDGVWKVLDPVMVFAAERWYLTGVELDRFIEFCTGSRCNRIVPCDLPAGAPLVTHTHDSITLPEVPTEVDARAAAS